jgi:hypothetical protein
MQDFLDAHFTTEDGRKMMSSALHEAHFAKDMREKTKSARARWDSATVAMQKAGIKDPVTKKVKWFLDPTRRHVDGNNSSRKGWNYTVVYSVLVWQGDLVYRLTVIAYTRECVQGWLLNEFDYSRPIADIAREYRRERNGNMAYEDFHLAHDMSDVQVLEKGDGRGPRCRLFPQHAEPIPGEERKWTVEDSLDGKDYTFSLEKGEGGPSPLKWKNAYPPTTSRTTGKRKRSDDLGNMNFKFINPREFVCRYPYPGSYAWAINLLGDIYPWIGDSKRKMAELAYTALLCNSAVQFVAVVLRWVFEPPVELQEQTEESKNLCHLYYLYCQKWKLCERGGIMPRTECQGGLTNWPTTKWMVGKEDNEFNRKLQEDKWEEQMQAFMDGVRDLESGKYIKAKKVKFCPDCFGLGDMTGYGFAAVCVFTGLCRSDAAIEVATRAHKYKNATYDATIGKMIAEIGEKEGREELKRFKRAAYYSGRAKDGIQWQPVYKSLGEIFEEQRDLDGENVCCAVGRAKEQADIFVYGQDLYTIRQGRIWMKRWGETDWEDFIGARAYQRMRRREAVSNKQGILPTYIRQQEDVPEQKEHVV